MIRNLLGALLFFALFCAGGEANATLITFSSDQPGFYPVFESVDAPGVQFSAVLPSSIFVSAAEGNPGPALVSFNSGFLIEFSFPVVSLSMELGNDDLCCGSLGDVATLSTFLGGAPVATLSLALNFNDVMDQTILLSGSLFDAATIQYLTPGGLISGPAVAIDNIEFLAAIPEPPALALFALLVAWLASLSCRCRDQSLPGA